MLVTRLRAAAVQCAPATVMFADLRGYTGMAERLPAVRVVPLLDEFFCTLAAAAKANRGTVFHTAGDEIMVGFGVDDASGAGQVIFR